MRLVLINRLAAAPIPGAVSRCAQEVGLRSGRKGFSRDNRPRPRVYILAGVF